MTKKLEGIIPAMATPFRSNGEVDLKALRREVNFLIDKRVSGLLVLGGTGESVCLSEPERQKVIDTAVDASNGRVPIIAGIFDIPTGNVISQAKYAKDAHVDALLLVPPYFVFTLFKNIYAHFQSVAEKVDMPIILFHTPKRSGVTLTVDQIEKCFQIDNIVGIKECSRNLTLVQTLIKRIGDKFSMFSGVEDLTLSMLILGAKGAMHPSATVAPELWIRMFEALKRGDLSEAVRLNYELLPLNRVLYNEPNPAPLKEALAILGRPAGLPRPPLLGVEQSTTRKLKQVLADMKLIPKP